MLRLAQSGVFGGNPGFLSERPGDSGPPIRQERRLRKEKWCPPRTGSPSNSLRNPPPSFHRPRRNVFGKGGQRFGGFVFTAPAAAAPAVAARGPPRPRFGRWALHGSRPGGAPRPTAHLDHVFHRGPRWSPAGERSASGVIDLSSARPLAAGTVRRRAVMPPAGTAGKGTRGTGPSRTHSWPSVR